MTQTYHQSVGTSPAFSRRRAAGLPHLGNFFLGNIYQALTGRHKALKIIQRRAVANGLQPDQVENALKQSRNIDELPQLFSLIAQNNLEKALYWDDVAVRSRARDHYLDSALWDILAFLLLSDETAATTVLDRCRASYSVAAPHFLFPAAAVEIPLAGGKSLSGYLRLPQATPQANEIDSDKPATTVAAMDANHPCVVLFNGISSPKEELHFTENAFLAAGLATLSFDYPTSRLGNGDIDLCGDVAELGNAIWQYASSRAEIDMSRLAAYGTSIGGRLALYTALKFPERFACVAILSTPYDLLADLELLLPAMRRELAATTDCSKDAIFQLAQQTPLRNLLPQMNAPLLVATGTKDVIAMPEEAKLIYELSASIDKKLIICSNASHNCYEMMPSLRHEIATWIRQRM